MKIKLIELSSDLINTVEAIRSYQQLPRMTKAHRLLLITLITSATVEDALAEVTSSNNNGSN